MHTLDLGVIGLVIGDKDDPADCAAAANDLKAAMDTFYAAAVDLDNAIGTAAALDVNPVGDSFNDLLNYPLMQWFHENRPKINDAAAIYGELAPTN